MTTTIRPCTQADIDQLRAISNDAKKVLAGAPQTHPTLSADSLSRQLSTPNARFYFAFVGCSLAGYLKLNSDDAQSEQMGPDYLQIERLFVKPTFEANGLVQALIDHAQTVATKHHKHYLWLRPADSTTLQPFLDAGFHEAVQPDGKQLLEKHLTTFVAPDSTAPRVATPQAPGAMQVAKFLTQARSTALAWA